MELMRSGFSDADDFGFGFVARSTASGRLDAPDLIPAGSMESPQTIAQTMLAAMVIRGAA